MSEQRWWTPRDVAIYWRLNIETIYRRIRSGDLPAARLPNGVLRISEADAMSYGRRIAAGARRKKNKKHTTIDDNRRQLATARTREASQRP